MVAKITALDVALAVGGTLVGTNLELAGVSTLSDPRKGTLAFAGDRWKLSSDIDRAVNEGAVVLVPSEPGPGMIEVANPRAAFGRAVSAFFVPTVEPGIHPTALVDATATVHPTAHIGAYTVIGAGSIVGSGAEVRNHVVIAAGVEVGPGCLIKSHAVIGEEGFGIDRDDEGRNLRIPHVGGVRLGDAVEIGAFTTVCSGTIAPTRIGDHTKIDDHVHISHNVQIGTNVIVTACAEISGSVVIGDDAWIGPNASIIQGKSIGARALLGIGAVATRSIDADVIAFGNPAQKVRMRDGQ